MASCSAPNLLVQPASLGTPHILLALEGQRDGGTGGLFIGHVRDDNPYGSTLRHTGLVQPSRRAALPRDRHQAANGDPDGGMHLTGWDEYIGRK